MATLPTISRGSRGEAVKLCQQRLTIKGWKLKVDGDFGPKTEASVEQFQAAHDLETDGIVGPNTWNMLMAEGRAKTPQELLDEQRQWLIDQIPDGTDPKVRAVLEVACKDLGLREVPAGSNAGPEIAHLVEGYNEYWLVLTEGGKARHKAKQPLRPEDYVSPMAWCGMAVSNWIRMGLGLPKFEPVMKKLAGHPFERFLGGPGPVEAWAKPQGRFFTDLTHIPAGAAFTMNRDGSGSDPSESPRAGHIGLVVKDLGAEGFLTIEGNVSDSVGSYKRKKDHRIRGYATWW